MKNRYDFVAKDGKKISVVEWTVENPKAIIQLSHGMAEHVLRYEEFANILNENGYTVFGDDHRSFGFTDNGSGYTEGDTWSLTLSDLSELTDKYINEYNNKKIYLIGHSYGSFLTQAYIQQFGNKIAGAVIIGSCNMNNISVPFGHLVSKIGKLFKGEKAPAYLIKALTFDAYDKKLGSGSFINSNLEEALKYRDDKLCGCICSYNFYEGFFGGLKKIYNKKLLNNIPKDLPLLLIAGEDDPVGNMGKGMISLEKMYKNLGIKNVKLCLYPGNRHEILRDTSKNEAISEILEFLK